MNKSNYKSIYLFKKEDQTENLYIKTGLTAKTFMTLNLAEVRKSPGLLLDKHGQISEWTITGNKEIDGEIYLIGNGFPGYGLDELDYSAIDSEIFIQILTLAEEMKKRQYDLPELLPGSFFRGDDGSLLLFSRKLVSYLRTSLSEDLVSRGWGQYQPFTHNKIYSHNFSLALLAYSSLTGKNPWFDDDPRLTGRRKQDRKINPLSVRFPKANKDFFSYIDQILSGKSGSESFSLDEWKKWIAQWKSESSFKLKESDGDNEEKLEKSYTRRQWFRKRRGLLAGIAAAVLVAGGIAGTYIKNAMAPPPQQGMDPIETITYFYDCFNTVDNYTMEKICLANSAKPDIDQVMYLHINSKTQEAYEQINPLVSGADWAAGKITDPQPRNMVFGISDLTISQTGDDEYEAEYIKWIPDMVETDEIEKMEELMAVFRPPLRYERKDKITLTEKDGAWYISDFEKIYGEE